MLKKIIIRNNKDNITNIWTPDIGMKYYFVDVNGHVDDDIYNESVPQRWCITIGNCFKTVTEACQYRNYLIVYQKLYLIAKQLDNEFFAKDSHALHCVKKGEHSNIPKYYISYNMVEKRLQDGPVFGITDNGIYCYNKEFKTIALSSIDNESLIDFLTYRKEYMPERN